MGPSIIYNNHMQSLMGFKSKNQARKETKTLIFFFLVFTQIYHAWTQTCKLALILMKFTIDS